MYNFETLEDLMKKTEEWNEKYGLKQDQVQIRLYLESCLTKYDLYIDPLEPEANYFLKVCEITDQDTVYALCRKIK